ncbi:phytochelatin synthase, partial [Verrucosispora sp. SN26_14.1]
TDNGNTVTIADSANPDHARYDLHINDLANWIATRGYATTH